MMYVVAIKDARAWHGLSPLQLSMVGFWNLIVVWMKVESKLFLADEKISSKPLAAPHPMAFLPLMGVGRWN
jgi:hypothetical protein